mmetsp:Transcript_4900/g.7558  ORF Transcript_4900/g.7558 Transcript_4900/m.7558 type:complete len:98 (+) Transcript_4900:210-503(+)
MGEQQGMPQIQEEELIFEWDLGHRIQDKEHQEEHEDDQDDRTYFILQTRMRTCIVRTMNTMTSVREPTCPWTSTMTITSSSHKTLKSSPKTEKWIRR